MSTLEPDPDPAAAPIRVAETTVAAYQWDAWRESAGQAFQRAHRVAVAASVLTSAALAAAGLLLLPGGSKVSVAVYTPLAGWAVWSWLRRTVARRGMAPTVEQSRSLVVPALVDTVDDDALVGLLRNGGTLVTERSTTIVEVRRDSLVALVASEYDLSDVPSIFPSAGGGP